MQRAKTIYKNDPAIGDIHPLPSLYMLDTQQMFWEIIDNIILPSYSIIDVVLTDGTQVQKPGIIMKSLPI